MDLLPTKQLQKNMLLYQLRDLLFSLYRKEIGLESVDDVEHIKQQKRKPRRIVEFECQMGKS